MSLPKRFLVAVVLFIAAGIAAAQNFPLVHPDTVIAKYGKPDHIDSTENDKPRPPIVTRLLEYRKERVRFVFFADGPVGSPPPYSKWRLMGMQDPRNDSVLSADEVTRRMQKRTTKASK